jgi:hypothetical protein
MVQMLKGWVNKGAPRQPIAGVTLSSSSSYGQEKKIVRASIKPVHVLFFGLTHANLTVDSSAVRGEHFNYNRGRTTAIKQKNY